MSFPVNSTSVETPAIKRVVRVLERANIADSIAYGGVFNCRTIAGSSDYSQHAWGNAIDLFPRVRQGEVLNEVLRHIADQVVAQATKATVANKGRKIPVSQVIDHNNRRIWTPSMGWHTYTGNTGAHVHVSGAPLKTGVPPCA